MQFSATLLFRPCLAPIISLQYYFKTNLALLTSETSSFAPTDKAEALF